MAVPRPAAAVGSPEELVARAARGDTYAFARLVRLHHESMTSIALVVTGDPDRASAAVTGALGRAWSALRTPLRRRRRTPELGPWLAWLAADEAVGRIEDEAVLRAGVRDYASEAEDETPPTPLGPVRARDRAMLALVVVAGLTADDVAAASGRRPHAVRGEIEQAFAVAARALAPGAGAADARSRLERDVRRLAGRAMPLVDADLVVRRAIGAGTPDWPRVMSVVIGVLVGLAAASLPYWAPLVWH